ncbi:MAG TPA: glucose 1-dehydrogenase [Ilumatobacter sp.]|nr:glucose 1-dehydrogenase [Ilumatobacter sp.]
MGRLSDKVCLITGGARGQGAAEARRFVAEGATVYITDVLVDEGERTAADTGAVFLRHDVTSQSDWDAVTARVLDDSGQLDVLVNNAAVFSRRIALTETSRELWDRTLAVNQTGVFLGMQAAATPMISARKGSIVNISSIAGMQGTLAFAYTASKWAVRGMTKSAAQELGPHGIRVNSVHPGIITTEMIGDLDVDEHAKRVPLRRCGTADDVAELVLWLASDESSYASGAEFVIDGGLIA